MTAFIPALMAWFASLAALDRAARRRQHTGRWSRREVAASLALLTACVALTVGGVA